MPRSRFQIVRRRLIVLISIVVVMLVIQWFLWRAVTHAAGRYQDQRTQENQLVNLQKRLDEIAVELQGHTAVLGQTALSFPEVSDTAGVVEDLERLATERGLTLTITSLKEQQQKALVFLTPFLATLEVVGPPRSLLEFMDRLEHAETVIEVTSWSLEAQPAVALAPGQAEVMPTAKLSLTAQVYLQSRFHETR